MSGNLYVQCFVKNTFIYICDKRKRKISLEEKRKRNGNDNRSRYRYTLAKRIGAFVDVNVYHSIIIDTIICFL